MDIRLLLECTMYIIILIFLVLLLAVEVDLIFLLTYINYLVYDKYIKCKKVIKKPGKVSLSIISQGENGMLKFVLVLPPKGAEDVVKREVTVTVGSVGPNLLTLDGAANETELLDGNDGEVVVGNLVDVDDAGNRSEAREFNFTLVDTIAPPQPGEVGVRVVSE